MAKEVLMPKLSSTMDVGHVVEWYKQEGDKVAIGEAIFEVMTDKIAIEVEAYDEGVLLKRYVEVGEVVPVNTVIAHIGEPGEVVSQPVSKATSSAPEENTKKEVSDEVTATPILVVTPTRNKDVRATPSARKIARENNLDLVDVFNHVQPEVRLHYHDVKSFIQSAPQSSTAPQVVEKDTIIPWKGIRKMVADQMSKSVKTAPHVTLNAEVNVDKLIELRASLIDQVKKDVDVRVSYTHLLAYFVSRVLIKHPLLNANALEDGIHLKKTVNLGIAVALEDGLIVPVVKQANHRTLSELSLAISTLAKNASNNKLSPDDLKDGTFTLTSLGTTAVSSFNPIINIPEVAILGVGSIKQTFKLDKINTVQPTNVMTLSLSFDHRAVDGYPAALFLTDLVKLIENPGYLVQY